MGRGGLPVSITPGKAPPEPQAHCDYDAVINREHQSSGCICGAFRGTTKKGRDQEMRSRTLAAFQLGSLTSFQGFSPKRTTPGSSRR